MPVVRAQDPGANVSSPQPTSLPGVTSNPSARDRPSHDEAHRPGVAPMPGSVAAGSVRLTSEELAALASNAEHTAT
jgi:hypothetical protein